MEPDVSARALAPGAERPPAAIAGALFKPAAAIALPANPHPIADVPAAAGHAARVHRAMGDPPQVAGATTSRHGRLGRVELGHRAACWSPRAAAMILAYMLDPAVEAPVPEEGGPRGGVRHPAGSPWRAGASCAGASTELQRDDRASARRCSASASLPKASATCSRASCAATLASAQRGAFGPVRLQLPAMTRHSCAMRSPRASRRSELEGAAAHRAFAGVMIFDRDWKLVASVASWCCRWSPGRWSRIGGSPRRAATRGMEETGNLTTTLSEALRQRAAHRQGLWAGGARSAARIAAQLARAAANPAESRAPGRRRGMPTADIFHASIVVAGTLVLCRTIRMVHHELDVARNQLFASFHRRHAARAAASVHAILSQLWAYTSSGMAAAQRVFAVVDARPAIVDAAGAQSLSVARAPRGGARCGPRCRKFGYLAGESPPATAAIDQVTLDIARRGQKVALVGPSSAGKND